MDEGALGVQMTQAGAGMMASAGALLGSELNAEEQRATNQKMMDFNAGEAEKSRQFQERMSNSAYQRSMADMKAAGLNPCCFQPGGASTPLAPRPQLT